MAKRFEIGDPATWNSQPGRVSGMIVAIHTGDFVYKGYMHRTTEDDPHYDIKSYNTDVAAHKGGALDHAWTPCVELPAAAR